MENNALHKYYLKLTKLTIISIIYVISTGFCRGNASDTLDEKDCGAESEDDDGIPSSQPKGAIQQRTTKVGAEEGDSQVTLDMPEDEDDSIDDFDDD